MKKLKVFLFIVVLCVIFLPVNKVMAESKYTYAYINATDLGPRTCPSTSCNRVYSDEGRIIWLNRPRTIEVIEYTGDWAKIRWNWYGFTYEGYIMKKYLGNPTEYALDENYMNTLRSKGFPESYVVSLAKLHAVHNNWNFEASNTNVSLDEAVSNEYSPVYKNLINTSNKNQLSTDGSAYSNGTYIQFEPGWYAPSRDTLKYYMDPRNFLDDNSIFMFEQLSNNSSVTKDDVQSLLNGTFLSGNYVYNNQTLSYAETFLSAGRDYNVNSIHLAARVLQEQGTDGRGATIAMTYSDGLTYYNYFNFNATGSSNAEIISNALNYAVKNNWNNPYVAIRGGAQQISNGYITNNQDTLYYQKFNIVGNSSKYWHQYMSNIQAPYTESYSTYKSYYNSNLINTAFTFKIPVYSDMGGSTVIATKSNNNNLSNLTITDCTLSPKFDSAITEYTCEVKNSTSSVKVTATKSDTKANVTGDGEVKLTSDSNEIKVKVTAEDNQEKTYTITVNKLPKEEAKRDVTQSPQDIVSSVGLNNNNNNLSGFTLGTDVSKIKEDITSRYSNVTVKVYDSNDKEITSGLIATGQQIQITSNSTIKYTVSVKGDTNGDGKIGIGDYAKINDYILGKATLTNPQVSAADTNGDGKIGIGDYAKVKDYILGKINNIN